MPKPMPALTAVELVAQQPGLGDAPGALLNLQIQTAVLRISPAAGLLQGLDQPRGKVPLECLGHGHATAAKAGLAGMIGAGATSLKKALGFEFAGWLPYSSRVKCAAVATLASAPIGSSLTAGQELEMSSLKSDSSSCPPPSNRSRVNPRLGFRLTTVDIGC